MQIDHIPIKDYEVIKFIDTTLQNLNYATLQSFNYETFENAWRSWINLSTYNTITGLDTMKHSGFSLGTTHAFAEFLARYNTKRIRASRSDFVLTKILCKQYNRELKNLEDEPLEEGDALVISLPFSGNGSTYPDFEHIITQCNTLDIPVLLDGAYFGISHGINYNLNNPCIKDFVISITKTFGCEIFRSGIRFTREPIDDGITAPLLGPGYFDKLNTYVTVQLLKNFSHNSFMSKYLSKSTKVCKKFDLTASNTFTLALSKDEKFKRGDFNRVCITEYLS